MIATKTIIKWIRPVQLLMTLAVCMILVTICQMIVYGISLERAQRAFERRRSQNVTVSEADRTQKEFLFDGTIVLVRQTTEPTTGRVKIIQVADANNRTLYEGPPDKNPYAFISWSREGPGNFQIETALGDMSGYYGLNPDFSRMLCVRMVGPDQRRSVTWVYDPGLGALAGYDLNGRVTGYLGAQGLALRRQDVRPFEEGRRLSRLKRADSANPTALWIAEHSVYLIDFDAAKVRQIFHLDDHSMLGVAVNHWDDSSAGPYSPSVTMFTDGYPKAVYLPNSQQLVPVTIPSDSPWSFSSVVATQQGLYLTGQRTVGAPSRRDFAALVQWWQSRNQPVQCIIQLMQVQNNGDLKRVSFFEWTRPMGIDPSYISQERWKRRISRAVGVVSPLPVRWIPDRLKDPYGGNYKDANDGPHYLRSLIQPFLLLAVYIPANLAVTLALAALTFLHARPRRTGWGRLVLWLVLVLLFNLAGFLTYLALNHTPVIRCPACGKRRGLLRPDCPACHALLPPPRTKPTDLILPVLRPGGGAA